MKIGNKRKLNEIQDFLKFTTATMIDRNKNKFTTIFWCA